MTDQIRIQEFGSEIEDILSGEISLDRLYTAQIQKLISISPRQKVLDDNETSLLIKFANPLTSDVSSQDSILTLPSSLFLLPLLFICFFFSLLTFQEGVHFGTDLQHLTKRALLTAYSKFLSSNYSNNFPEYEKIHQLLKGLSAYLNQHADKSFLAIGTFEINRAHALGYFKEMKFANAVKYLNTAVAHCPKHRDIFVGGLSDTLILLAECYSALGR